MNRCLICFDEIGFSLTNKKVCTKCLERFETIDKNFNVDGYEMLILYKYNDFFKELLYRFKGCYDFILKDAFINDNLYKIKKLYKGRSIICAPSYIDSDIKRGFNHVKAIAGLLNLPIIDCLTKEKDYKQSNSRYQSRKNIFKVIKIDKTKLNDVKRVLIFDDVTTSLSTIRAIIRLLPTNIDIKILVLASNCRFLENEII